MERRNRVFSKEALENLARVFAKHQIEYLIIGKSGAIIYGFPDTTQDIDIFPKRSPENGRRMVSALKELGFPLDDRLEAAIREGKDFIQIRGEPFDIDLVFAPDGLESFEEARKRSKMEEGRFPVAAIEDIIHSKKISGRQKDREVLARLEAFAKYLKKREKS